MLWKPLNKAFQSLPCRDFGNLKALRLSQYDILLHLSCFVEDIHQSKTWDKLRAPPETRVEENSCLKRKKGWRGSAQCHKMGENDSICSRNFKCGYQPMVWKGRDSFQLRSFPGQSSIRAQVDCAWGLHASTWQNQGIHWDSFEENFTKL